MNVFDEKPVSGNPLRPAFGGVVEESTAAAMTQRRFNAIMSAIRWAERDWEVEVERNNPAFASSLESLREARRVLQKQFPLQAKGATQERQS